GVTDEPPAGVAQCGHGYQLEQRPPGVSPDTRPRRGYPPAPTAHVGRLPCTHVGEQPIGAGVSTGVAEGRRREVGVGFLGCSVGSKTTSSAAVDCRCCAVWSPSSSPFSWLAPWCA